MQEPGPNAVDVFDQLLASNAQIQLELEALKAQIAGTFEVRLAQVFFVVGTRLGGDSDAKETPGRAAAEDGAMR